MHLQSDISSALLHIEAIKSAIDDLDDAKLQMSTSENIKLILNLLQDPVLRSIVQVQDSLSELNKTTVQHPSIIPKEFDISTAGELIISVPACINLYDPDYTDEQLVPSAQISPRSPNSSSAASLCFSSHNTTLVMPSAATSNAPPEEDSNMLLGAEDDAHNMNLLLKKTRGYTEEERPQSAVSNTSKHLQDIMSAEWAQIQSLELVNDGTGLGFGIIGARTSGVIVKTILPGGVADRDGRLISGDHILQIGDVNLHDMVSEQVASVLRQSGTHVRLVVARPVDPMNTSQDVEGTAIVPARLLSDPNELERYLIAAGYPDIFGMHSTPSTPTPVSNDKFNFHHDIHSNFNEIQSIANRPPMSPPSDLDLPETERFNVELTKDTNGLGITIAGYVCEKEELSGIFVKSVSAGSAADLSGRIQVNDRIIEVDQQSLHGYSNHQAVEVLKKSGMIVNLCLERYLRGPKYDQLQQAIAANEMKPSTPSSNPMAMVRPNSGMSTGSSHDLNRRPSIHDSYSKDVMGDGGNQYMRSLERGEKNASHATITPSKSATPPVAVVSGTVSINRKLVQARDSIENKLGNDADSGATAAATIEDMAGNQSKVSLVQAINVKAQQPHKYWVDPILTVEMENTIINRWSSILDSDMKVIVAQIQKFNGGGGLGISLEGTVDVEGGMEVRPHHYIRSILPDGPVGLNGIIRSGDELLGMSIFCLLKMMCCQKIDFSFRG